LRGASPRVNRYELASLKRVPDRASVLTREYTKVRKGGIMNRLAHQRWLLIAAALFVVAFVGAGAQWGP